MPRNGQIIPQYLHPHVATYINDNTIFEEVVAAPEEGIKLICVFTSGKGRDGVLLNKQTVDKFTAEYGYPNYRLHGQPIYMPLAALNTRVATVNCMRVMPENATYSNIVILAKVKKDADKLVVKHEVICHNGLMNADEMQTLTDGMATSEEDENGFITIPLCAIRSLGRGTYGDAFRVRIAPSPQSDKDNNFKNYRFEVFEAENGFKKLELFEGTFFQDAVTNTGTAYIGDVFNDTITGSQKLGMYVNELAVPTIYNMYAEVAKDTDVQEWQFDSIFGLGMDGKPLPKFETVVDVDSVNLNTTEGIRLSYGTDGDFAINGADPSVRENAINAAYTKAFQGEYDKTISSKRRMPANLLLDANYPEEVKRSLIDLALRRGDCRLYLDGGLMNTTTEAVAWGKSMQAIASENISKEFQHYITKDPFSNRNIAVTMTYFMVDKMVRHFDTNGVQVPFVGENYAMLSGHVRNSLKPVVDVDDQEIKEELYGLKLNYYEAVGEDMFVRATQSTSQAEWSDLSEENNALVLLEIKNLLEDLVYSLSYNFAMAGDRARFTDDAMRLVTPYKGNKVEDINVYFDMNEWENQRSILHCYTAITYRGIAKRGIIEIDINKRA